MTTVIRKATAPDLLAAIPAMIERDPLGSVVLISFRGKLTHAVLRLDIPRANEKRFAATALGMFCKIQGADDVVPVICSDAPIASHAELMSTLVRRFRQAGFAVRDALTMGSDGWSSHLDPDSRVHPLAEVELSAARLDLAAPNEPPERVPPADELSRRRMRDALARIRMLEHDEDDEPDIFQPLYDLPFFAEKALDWSDTELAENGPLLLYALQLPLARDTVMLQWAFGLEFGDAMCSGDTCVGIEARKIYPDVDLAAAEYMLGHGPAPDGERIARAIDLLTSLTARAEDAERPAPLCMLAWLHWACGRGSTAGVHIGEVRAIAPEYSMGQLLASLFSSGAMPEWIFTAPSP